MAGLMTGVFACACCGECCQGKGGIVLLARDTVRLAAHLGLEAEVFVARYTEGAGGKRRLGSEPAGGCIFLESTGRCGVHAARPEVCRAWPFFRGNMVDAVSFEMAAAGCPGIRHATPFATFVRTGAAYLLTHGIFVTDADYAPPSALMPEAMLQGMAHDESGSGEEG